MRKVTQSGFDIHLQQMLKGRPGLARDYARRLAEFPLSTQLAILRRRRWLSQRALARKMRAKQPHVARVENPAHDPRLSSVQNQARALQCHLVLVPDEFLAQVAWIVAGDSARSAPPA